ncbi:hypothetical protein TWF788_005393 [Orbilia oligospora]|uniref:Peptidase metallopeptidase domain-containing protein n=2 Tax=Orbilia oligospora TaxID=2813651 RepID=A0A7C8U215_ORBOL|nr:hypothetical protein TWF788_005393 [Orbilia oligospora]
MPSHAGHVCSYNSKGGGDCMIKSGGILIKRQDFFQDAPRKWPQGFAFRWRLTGTIQNVDYNSMVSAVERAFQKWTNATNLFTFQQAPNGGHNIEIMVAGPQVNDPEFPPRAGGGYTLANGLMGPQGYDSNPTGRIKFNNTYSGTPSWNIASIHNVFVHEFGHVLGLGHVPNAPSALMSPIIPNMQQEIGLTNFDLNKFHTFYAGYGGTPMYQQPTNQYPQQPQQPQQIPQQPQQIPQQPSQPQQPQQRPQQGDRSICDNAHTECWRRRQAQGLARVKRGNKQVIVKRQYNDPCRPEWEQCMREQGFIQKRR